MNNNSFDSMLERIKEQGDKECETIEIAEEISSIINELSEARLNKGMTQRQLAEKSGIKQSAIARMETLQVIPRLDTIVRIARCLGVTIKAEEEPNPEKNNSASIFLCNYNWNPKIYFSSNIYSLASGG